MLSRLGYFNLDKILGYKVLIFNDLEFKAKNLAILFLNYQPVDQH
jgi:hypothetical protein